MIQAKIILLTLSFPRLRIIWSSSPFASADIFRELKTFQLEPSVDKAILIGADSDPDKDAGNGAGSEVNGAAEDLLRCFPVKEWRERRRNNCRGVSNVLKGLSWLRVLEADAGDGTCQFSGVVLFDSEARRDLVRRELTARQIFLPVLWDLEDAAIPGIPEKHRRFSKTLLCIPCDARYDQATIERVSGLIRDIGDVLSTAAGMLEASR